MIGRLRAVQPSTTISAAVVLYVLAAGALWAAVTPPGGVPDEPSHVVYAAGAVRGDLGGIVSVNHPHYPGLPAVEAPR